jgi:SAM-dependent methyltransferase
VRELANNRSVLDLGCGNGLRAKQFPKSNYLGLDPSDAAANAGAAFVQGIAECMPVRSGFFDFVLSVDVFDHLISPRHAVAEILRVLKPGGHLYLTVGDAKDKFFHAHRQSRQMFGIREVEAHLHQFNSLFFEDCLAAEFAKFEVIPSKAFLFVHGEQRKSAREQ